MVLQSKSQNPQKQILKLPMLIEDVMNEVNSPPKKNCPYKKSKKHKYYGKREKGWYIL